MTVNIANESAYHVPAVLASRRIEIRLYTSVQPDFQLNSIELTAVSTEVDKIGLGSGQQYVIHLHLQ